MGQKFLEVLTRSRETTKECRRWSATMALSRIYSKAIGIAVPQRGTQNWRAELLRRWGWTPSLEKYLVGDLGTAPWSIQALLPASRELRPPFFPFARTTQHIQCRTLLASRVLVLASRQNALCLLSEVRGKSGRVHWRVIHLEEGPLARESIHPSSQRQSSCGRDAHTSTRDACATRRLRGFA